MTAYIDPKELDKWNANKSKDTLLNRDLIDLISDLNDAINDNNISAIKDIILSEKYPKVSKDKKEEIIFNNVATLFADKDMSKAKEVLDYLIFDYKISEENSINKIVFHVDERIKQMFKVRDMKEELNTELKDTLSTNKKIKL